MHFLNCFPFPRCRKSICRSNSPIRSGRSDRTVFGVGTSLITFTEQSRTTFRDKAGRLSIILTPPDKIIGLKDEEIFEIFKRDAPRLGIDTRSVIDYRVIRHPGDFYLLSLSMNKLRPRTLTSVEGLFLAGDYVKQSFMATMEGGDYG